MAGEREMIHERKIHQENFSLVEGVGGGFGFVMREWETFKKSL